MRRVDAAVADLALCGLSFADCLQALCPLFFCVAQIRCMNRDKRFLPRSYLGKCLIEPKNFSARVFRIGNHGQRKLT